MSNRMFNRALAFGASLMLASNLTVGAQSITFKDKQVSLKQAFEKIEMVSQYKVAYNGSQLDVTKVVALKNKKTDVLQLVGELLDGTNCTYSIKGNYIVITPKQEGTVKKVKGVVKDVSGEPVIGATIMEKGTTNGTITDIDGKFEIEASSNSLLEISYIGYQTQQMSPVEGKIISVVLKEDTEVLDEVVVVGYGVMKKSDVTGSISVAKSDDLLKGQTFSAVEGLKGKASGVNVFSNSGQPGGGMRVVIRGVGTINSSSDPLYVVDGVVMEDFKYLNPNDIERIEVLKDASSSAIYGARGANGVVLVTTKRGKSDTGINISYNGSLNIGTMAKYMDLMDSNEWMQAFSTSMENANKWYGANKSTNPADYFKDPDLFRPDGTPIYNTDWQKEATRTTLSHNHQLNIQQGNEKTSTGVFLNYTDQEGLLLNNYMKRLNAKLTFDAKPYNWLETGVNLLVNHTWGNETDEGKGNKQPRRTMIEMMPFMPVKFPDGRWSGSTTITDNMRIENISNPVHNLETVKQMRYRTQIFGNASLTFHILPELDLMTQIGIDSHNNRQRNFFPKDLRGLTSFPLGEVNLVNNESLYWQEETFVTYKDTFGKHRINAMLGMSWQGRNERTSSITSKGFDNSFSGFDNIGAGTQPGIPESNYFAWTMNSYFCRLGYTYDDRYLLTATGRIDGSSRFGSNNKYGAFPSLGLGWVISNENFMKNIHWINNLKLHTSYGVTGNTDIQSYAPLAIVQSGSTLINNALVPSSKIGTLANPDLEWEKTRQFDVGLDFSAFNSRLNVELSYYNKYTYDLLLNRPVPYHTGFQSVMDNIGSVRNQGVDLMINSTNIETDDFQWSTTFNLNYNKNKIESLGENNSDIFPGPYFVNTSSTILRVGESLGSFWGYRRLGVWTESEADEAKKVGQHVGEVKRSSEMEILGKGLPDFTGSFINTFRYKNFDLTIDLQFVAGVDIYQHFKHSTQDRFGLSNGLSSLLKDAWSPSNPNSLVPAVRYAPYFGQSTYADSGWVCNGSYLRGNLLQLGYNFNSQLVQRAGLKALRLYANVSNFFVLHSKDFEGYDPESTTYSGNKWGQNISFFEYPKPRTYTIGVNVTF